jgi:hypothetical protein
VAWAKIGLTRARLMRLVWPEGSPSSGGDGAVALRPRTPARKGAGLINVWHG